MKSRTHCFPMFLVICFACLSILPLSAVNVPDRNDMLHMLFAEQFDELSQMAEALRAEKVELYGSNTNTLARFYDFLEIGEGQKEDVWKEYLEHLQHWVKAKPDSAMPLIVLGNAYTSYAWHARGGGWASSVTDEGWRLFRLRLDQARACLEKAEKMPTKDAQVYEVLLTVARGQHWPRKEMDAVFTKGIEFEPNCRGLYESKAGFLLPRWFGKPGEWESFATEMADARGGEEGDLLYLIIARSQAWSEGDEFFLNTQISYTRMKKGFEVALERKARLLYDTSSFCYFACIARDRDTAKTLFTKLDDRWLKQVWGDYETFKQWQAWAFSDSPAPVQAAYVSRSKTHNSPISSEKIKSILTIGAAVWLGLVAIVGIGIIFIIRQNQKS
jgi:hypothetical protein